MPAVRWGHGLLHVRYEKRIEYFSYLMKSEGSSPFKVPAQFVIGESNRELGYLECGTQVLDEVMMGGSGEEMSQ